MLEEFQEADDVIISPEQGFGHKKKGGGAQACRCSQTKPIDIQARTKVRHSSMLDSGRDEEDDDVDEGAGAGVDERKILPPHELVSSSRNGEGEKIACSVCFGNGRTLKGRDLRCFRNSALRMTGFLES